MAKQSAIFLLAGFMLLGVGQSRPAQAGDCMFGCWDRPTCGKVCKLVCAEKTLVAVGYGAKCNTIAVPCPSCEGCKHCACQCCPPDACGPCGSNKGDVCCGPCCPCCEAAPAKITFCWHDFFTCGGACPRTVKLLTKYQAEKKICWYHWEVVDGCNCGGPGCCPGGCDPGCGCAESAASTCPCVYKAAPADAQIGEAIELTAADRAELAAWIPSDGQEVGAAGQKDIAAPLATAAVEAHAAGRPKVEATAAAETQTQDVKPALWQRFANLLPTSKSAE
jgi:hypothetical protein